MLGQTPAILVQLRQAGAVDDPQIRQDHVEGRPRVALGQDEAVSVLPVGILPVDVHHIVVENRHDLDGGKRAAVMTAAGVVDGLKGPAPQFLRFLFHSIIPVPYLAWLPDAVLNIRTC